MITATRYNHTITRNICKFKSITENCYNKALLLLKKSINSTPLKIVSFAPLEPERQEPTYEPMTPVTLTRTLEQRQQPPTQSTLTPIAAPIQSDPSPPTTQNEPTIVTIVPATITRQQFVSNIDRLLREASTNRQASQQIAPIEPIPEPPRRSGRLIPAKDYSNQFRLRPKNP